MKRKLLFVVSFWIMGITNLLSQDAAVKVEMNDQQFTPSEVTLKAGEMVLWKNTSALVHTVTFDPSEAMDETHSLLPEGVQPFGSGKLEPGATYTHTFEVAGTYRYFCILHENEGMLGQVTVENASESNHSGHSHQQEQTATDGSETSEDHEDHQHSEAESHKNYEEYELLLGQAAKFKEFPNLHPMIVHFPVVLLIFAAAAQLMAFIMFRKEFGWAVFFLLLGGFVTGLMAANLWHPEIAADAPVEIRRIFGEHHSFANITLWLSGIALVVKLFSMLINFKVWAEIAVMLLLISTAVTVSYTGHLGSQMVYIENVGPQGKHVEEHSH